jgi:hypothetical protein
VRMVARMDNQAAVAVNHLRVAAVGAHLRVRPVDRDAPGRVVAEEGAHVHRDHPDLHTAVAEGDGLPAADNHTHINL